MLPYKHNLPIETAALILRAFVPEDAAKVFRMSQETAMRTWLPSQVYRDEEHAAAVLAFLISQYSEPGDPTEGPYVLGVQLKASGELIGHVGFSPLDDDVEVGFAIEEAHQRQGIATEAVRVACEWVTREFSISTLLGIAAAQNTGSQSVLLRAGFTRQEQLLKRFQGSDQQVIRFAFAGVTVTPGSEHSSLDLARPPLPVEDRSHSRTPLHKNPNSLFANWVRATTIGWLVGVPAVVLLAAAAEGLGESSLHSPVGGGVGLAVGFFQYRAIRNQLDRAGFWFWSSFLGFLLPFLVVDVARVAGISIRYSLYVAVICGGLITGVWQSILLRTTIASTILWIAVTVLGWAFASGAVRLADSLGRSILPRGVPGALSYLGIAASGGVALGIITGFALKRILHSIRDVAVLPQDSA